MSVLQKRLSAMADAVANLKSQKRELELLRDKVRKAELLVQSHSTTSA